MFPVVLSNGRDSYTRPVADQDDEAILTTAQVAALLDLTTKTVIQMAKDGRLPARRLHGTRKYLFFRREILDLVDRSRVDVATEADEEVLADE